MTAPKSYDHIAGQSLARLASLSDGVFSIAMTLLVLDLRAPALDTIHSEQDLWRGLFALGPRLAMYITTFLTLGIFWVGQQTQLNQMTRGSRNLAWIHIVFLFGVSVTPFSANLLAQYLAYRAAIFVYWLNILLLGSTLYWSWCHATRAGLVENAATSTPILRRIVIAQALYAAAALIALANTYVSISVTLLIQLYYAFGLHWPPLPPVRRP